MTAIKILIPVPAYGFDPTEAAIPWKVLSENQFEIYFASPEGKKAAADSLMLKGERLGIWKPALKARNDAVEAYLQMEKSESFSHPLSWNELKAENFDALLLPGGHDKGVKEYLESKILQKLVADFFIAEKPVAAICHGLVLAARSINPSTGKSVLYSYKTTSLLKSQEKLAYNLTRLWLKDYYLTYPEITVEDEVKSVLKDPANFLHGPKPLFRDSPENLDRGFFVRDRNFISARWPGDAYSFAFGFVKMLNEK